MIAGKKNGTFDLPDTKANLLQDLNAIFLLNTLSMMTTEVNKKIMNYFIDEVINNKNLNAGDNIVSQDLTEDVPFPGQKTGREGELL